MAAPTIEINGQKVSWAFIQKVRKLCGGDWDTTMDAFFKARKATGPRAIERYIMRGFVPDENGSRYALTPSTVREQQGMEPIRAWWKSLYEPKNAPMSFGAIMRQAMGM